MDRQETGIECKKIENGPTSVAEANGVQFYLEEMQRMNNQLIDAKRELTRALKAAEDAKREKEQLYSALNHDIRIPLSAIHDLTEIALGEINHTEMVRENLENIKKSSEYIASMITDILEIGKMENGTAPVEAVDFCLQKELKTIRILMTPLFENKNQDLLFDVPDEPFYLYGNWKYVRRIIANLLSNASKYTQIGGKIVLSAVVETDEDDIVWTTISVQDNGMGMTKEQKENLFTPYYRTDRDAMKTIQGTGLGLSIVKRFTAFCRGTIDVTSREDCGSTFTVRIPFAHGSRQVDNFDSLLKTKLRGRTICFLLCEDNPINTKMFEMLLEKRGFQADSAENGKEGVELFRRHPQKYAGVFMDMYMPVMGGLEAAQLIRQIDAKIPIVAVTGENDATARRKMLDIGVNEILEKPLDARKLYKTICQLIP